MLPAIRWCGLLPIHVVRHKVVGCTTNGIGGHGLVVFGELGLQLERNGGRFAAGTLPTGLKGKGRAATEQLSTTVSLGQELHLCGGSIHTCRPIAEFRSPTIKSLQQDRHHSVLAARVCVDHPLRLETRELEPPKRKIRGPRRKVKSLSFFSLSLSCFPLSISPSLSPPPVLVLDESVSRADQPEHPPTQALAISMAHLHTPSRTHSTYPDSRTESPLSLLLILSLLALALALTLTLTFTLTLNSQRGGF